MEKAILARSGLAATVACVAMAFGTVPALAAPFKCPRVGGDFVFGQEANVNSLDQPASNTISTRNVAMNIFETLITRDENNNPIPDLADSYTESPDRLTYTFKLRNGVKFHNGKPMTSADVVASFDRYARLGLERGMFKNVDKWEAPDASTFIIRMKEAQPTFIELLSSFSVPVVIVPAEQKDDAPMQLKTIGTGPWQLVDFVPGSHVKLKRYDGYTPNTHFEERTGFGGYKQACFDTVTFRIVTEPGARVAGLKTGELQGVEDLPTKALDDLKKDKNIAIVPLLNWWIQVAAPNTSVAPTDNVLFRKAVQAALDMDEIMDAATDGNYRLNVGFQYPNQPSYTDAGKEFYNIKDPAKAKQLLAQSGYKGEPVVLLTNKDYASMYNAALVMAEQLKAVGIKAELKVVDWPTSVNMQLKPDTGWNFFFTGYGTQPALGALATMQFFTPPNANYKPKDGKDDPDLMAAWNDMNSKPDAKDRQAAFARMQALIYERVYALPFGSLTKVQGVRANVQGFKPFRIPRMSNVWFSN
ncbi:ABC transporter substrate-binding protein [Limobrevibacterium gyesilva]|uniref:ABC transporter substrate-binding protein n=1 Tax=Limobrevibacterium gyesilva TaxID=2991712 RepID=A0AA41YLD2_9PROT|nr:ABC transporter substrate-binding protein [Limobrevibacterium gyesilva]MCW3475569.1 ABC transporter substrate-binding protein [Limobrevibacterium gyesilva]